MEVSHPFEDHTAVLSEKGNDSGLSEYPYSEEDSGSSLEDDDGGSSSEDDSGSSSEQEDDDLSPDSASESSEGGSDLSHDDCSLSALMKLTQDPSLGEELNLILVRCLEKPKPSKEEKIVEALGIVRCWQFTEYDPKRGVAVPTRFCRFNTALFDFEKECEYIHGPFRLSAFSIL
jgi:hypothetical protein